MVYRIIIRIKVNCDKSACLNRLAKNKYMISYDLQIENANVNNAYSFQKENRRKNSDIDTFKFNKID